ncbi:MAG: methyltransferase domain-containing protein [Roseburia sp.]|nr:methyltransferase domain-containing protein [Roseburia sp.]MDY5883151.1 methyltransferase domain-containing protein [Roseburia sp.]
MNHNDTIKQSFKKQAEKFAAYHMSKSEYTDYLVKRINADGGEHALEVAAGTCICGRALAPFVKDITCLDLTEEMLAQGKKLAEESELKNIYFEIGNAEKLPYESETFDLVITRLSLHHFTNPKKPFSEMKRVLKKGGKLIIWDMEATDESLRETDDKIETMRDPSHTRILSRDEFEKLFADGFELQCEEPTLVPVNLQSWMDLTDTPEDVKQEIVKLMREELAGGRKTGFSPYIKDAEIMFDHRWLLLIGIKL